MGHLEGALRRALFVGGAGVIRIVLIELGDRGGDLHFQDDGRQDVRHAALYCGVWWYTGGAAGNLDCDVCAGKVFRAEALDAHPSVIWMKRCKGRQSRSRKRDGPAGNTHGGIEEKAEAGEVAALKEEYSPMLVQVQEKRKAASVGAGAADGCEDEELRGKAAGPVEGNRSVAGAASGRRKQKFAKEESRVIRPRRSCAAQGD